MDKNAPNRLARVTAILTQLQTRRIVTATSLSEKFGVSTRTIYRDIRTLEQSGVPIATEDGKGYTLLEGYRIPPVTFTEKEANALILAEQLVLMNKDTSFVRDYSDAIDKIKSVLKAPVKEKVNLLADRTRFEQNINRERTSNHLSSLQFAITNFTLVSIMYQDEAKKTSKRIIEPFALLSTRENWLMIAYCRLRKDFRYFRVDRIKSLDTMPEGFAPHPMTLQEFFDKYH